MLGDRIRDYRQRARLTQSELARRAGTKQSVISAIEQGARANVTTGTLERLSAALGVPITALLEDGTRPDDVLPPVVELRETGWADEQVRAFLASWDTWSPGQRQRQRERVLAMHAEYQALHTEMEAARRKEEPQSGVTNGAKPRAASG